MKSIVQQTNDQILECIRQAWIEKYHGDPPSYRWCQAIAGLAEKADVAPYVIVARFPKCKPIKGWWVYLSWLSGKRGKDALILKDNEESFQGWLARLPYHHQDKGPSFQGNGPVSIEKLLCHYGVCNKERSAKPHSSVD